MNMNSSVDFDQMNSVRWRTLDEIGEMISVEEDRNDASIGDEFQSVHSVLLHNIVMTILGFPSSRLRRVVHNDALVEAWIEVKHNVIWRTKVDVETSVVVGWKNHQTETRSRREALNRDVHRCWRLEELVAETDASASSDHCFGTLKVRVF